MTEEIKGSLVDTFMVAPVIAYTYPKSLEPIIEYVNSLEYRMPEDGDSNYKSTDKWILKNEELKDLNDFCKQAIQSYAKEICHTKAKIGIQQSWVNLTPPGMQHPPHWHSNSYLSGVFYIASEQDGGSPLKLHSHLKNFSYQPTVMETAGDEPYNPYTCSSCELASIPGVLLVFSSMMPHSVPTNVTEQNRVSLSFNTFPETPFGDEDRLNIIT